MCLVSDGWMNYNYLKSRHFVEKCKAEIMELLQSDQERVVVKGCFNHASYQLRTRTN